MVRPIRGLAQSGIRVARRAASSGGASPTADRLVRRRPGLVYHCTLRSSIASRSQSMPRPGAVGRERGAAVDVDLAPW